MRRRIAGVITALLLLFPLAMSTVLAQDEALIKVSVDPNLGAILTDSEGNTLYLFTQDTTANETVCYDSCAVNWPVVTPEKATGLATGIPGELTVIMGATGFLLVTYYLTVGSPLAAAARTAALSLF